METEFLGLLDPLFETPIKILVKDILTLKKSEHESFVDDRSDIIPCILWNYNTKNRSDTLKLGALVRVLGSIRTHNEKKQIIIDTITELHDPSEESLHHIQVAKLKSKYQEPWSLPQLVKDNMNQLLERPASNSPGTELNTQKEIFTVAVYAFLLSNSPNAPFPFSFALLDKTLIKLAKKTISSKTPSDREIIQSFEKAITAICKKGLAKPCENTPGMYELIDRMALINFIISIVSETLQNMNTDQDGVRLNYIQTRVSEEFSELDNDDISKVVDNLCCGGLLYCCGHKEYKLLSTLQQ
ncbi:hypothetical protein BD770DRAFT_442067 [Pilaira anomala]|nr:hypothetical protein BD770DRAFT_442067 [Pilaira anomala]